MNYRVLSTSKRDAYIRYVEMPQRTLRPMELAANIGLTDETGDRELLQREGWPLVHPHRIARTPAAYQRYIQGCAQPGGARFG